MFFIMDDAYIAKLYDLERYKQPAVYAFYEDGKKAMDDYNKVTDFLKIIEQLESSGGKNFNHKEIKHGIHKGHRAAGSYGLMPNTVDETLNRMQQDKYDMERFKPIYDNRDPAFVKQYVEQNPEIEDSIARHLANRVLQKTNQDEEQAAYMWFTGHNQTPERIKGKYEEHPYTKRFRRIRDRLRNK